MDFEKRNNFLVGLLVITSLLIFLTVISFTIKSRFIKDGYYLKVEYHHIAGLQEGNEVTLGGYRVGYVEKILLLNKPTMHFEVYLFINNPISILKGTTAEIRNKGLMGQKYIELISPEKEEEFVKPNDVLKGGKSSGEYQDMLMIKFEEVTNNFNTTAQDVSHFFKTINLNETLATLNQTLNIDVKETIQLVQQDLVKIRQAMEALQQTAEDFSQTANSFTQAAGIILSKEKQIDKVISQLNHNLALLNKVLSNLEKISGENKEHIKNLIENLETTSLHTKELIEEIKKHPWKLIRKK